jgi:hypothetical protein
MPRKTGLILRSLRRAAAVLMGKGSWGSSWDVRA